MTRPSSSAASGWRIRKTLRDRWSWHFIQDLRAAGCFDASGFAVLPEFVIALRFAWLSEWLRKKDEEMVEMETDYVKLLLLHLEDLREAWKG